MIIAHRLSSLSRVTDRGAPPRQDRRVRPRDELAADPQQVRRLLDLAGVGR
ncbi:hypothetical protein [Nonomuraea rubra]|uniref:hypothetical protein n=1 Tax=Nonomuraea rubra TaxID=46180 RepID=UPI0031E93586